jgi:diazepam-binding inhibitor (GABA receptor modulator, acyl-CoA-binding protein)
MDMGLKEQFEQAQADSKLLTKKPPTDVLLQLYSLFKQGQEGDINIEPPTNMFDFVAKAKYGAWEKMKGMPKEQAMQEFIDKINELKAIS